MQSTHDTPFSPQAESSRPTPQLPFESQQPPQIAAQPVAASSLASSPSSLASSPAAASSPVGVPPELAAPLLLRPTPLELPELPLDPPDDISVVPASRLGVVVMTAPPPSP